MSILAIDPGTTKSGWALLTDSGATVKDFGWFDNKKIYTLIKSSGCPVVIEDVAHYGMPVGRDIFETVRWTGRFDHLATESLGLDVMYITRPTIKAALCNSVKATDANVRQAVIDWYGGNAVAIGGKKCLNCAGKGWRGREHTECVECEGEGVLSPRGQLFGASSHVWSALALGITYSTRRERNHKTWGLSEVKIY